MPGVLASFLHVDAAVDAIRALRARGIRDLVVYSAAPNHEIEEALEHQVSPVRLFTLIGGLTGCAAGFGDDALDVATTGRSLVGGKPIGSIPPYVVIAFELTILLRRAQHGGRGGALLGADGQARRALRSAVQRRHDRHLRPGRGRSRCAGGTAAPERGRGGGAA